MLQRNRSLQRTRLPRLYKCNIVESVLEGENDFGRLDHLQGQAPVVGVPALGPNDVDITHLTEDLSDAVIAVSVRRTDVFHGQAGDVLDDFFCPFDFRDDLFVGEGCQSSVRPGCFIILGLGMCVRVSYNNLVENEVTQEKITPPPVRKQE